MHIKKLIYLFIVIIMISIIAISGCEKMKKSENTKKLALKDIAFDVNKKSGFTVYINENSKLVPYLVLTSNYNGQALLLRKELLNDLHTFNDDSYGYSGYYKDSSIDKYLNGDFLSTLDPKIQSDIVDSEITITSKSSLGVTGEDTENITRKVFLLSYTEIGLTDYSVANKEGKPLKYFNDSISRIAYRNNEACSWWLRTSYTWDSNSVWGIGPKGSNGGGQVDRTNGIRPAFCISNKMGIEKSDKVIEGQTVYIITK